MNRILEKDLYLLALHYISLENGKINTTELLGKLRNFLSPQGEDIVPLNNRSDDKFSQIVRNLTAESRSFVRNGFIYRDKAENSFLFITEKGQSFLKKNKSALEELFKKGNSYEKNISILKNKVTE